MHDLFKDKILQGRVVEITSDGMMGETFVIVKVKKLKYYLIVPVSKTTDV